MESLSSEARARQVLANDNISFDSKFHIFNMKGESGATRVHFFPKLHAVVHQ